MSYMRTGAWFEPRTDAALLFSPCTCFSGCCHGNRQLSWCWWGWHLANVLQWAYNEAQGLVEVTSSSILGLLGSNQFLFFSFSFVLKLRWVSIGFYSRERKGYDSGATTLVTEWMNNTCSQRLPPVFGRQQVCLRRKAEPLHLGICCACLVQCLSHCAGAVFTEWIKRQNTKNNKAGEEGRRVREGKNKKNHPTVWYEAKP